MRNNLSLALIIGGGLCAGGVPAETSSVEKIKELMGNLAMRIDHQAEVKPAESNQPPFKSEQWIFDCGIAKRQINYGRYINSPPRDGSPSLVNYDMGIGLDRGAFGNWYRGNAIRVMIDRKDVMAQKTASSVEFRSDQQGYLRFTWELPEGNRMALSFVVPEDGHAVYARVGVSGPAAASLVAESLDIQLNGYPGGFAPAYKFPSHRWVQTAKAGNEVPPDHAGNKFPSVAITAGESWVFYADKLVRSGSLGLVFVPSEQPAGEVKMSNYGQHTSLRYPPKTTSCRLAFFAYDLDLDAAKELFSTTAGKELSALETMRFWPDEK